MQFLKPRSESILQWETICRFPSFSIHSIFSRVVFLISVLLCVSSVTYRTTISLAIEVAPDFSSLVYFKKYFPHLITPPFVATRSVSSLSATCFLKLCFYSHKIFCACQSNSIIISVKIKSTNTCLWVLSTEDRQQYLLFFRSTFRRFSIVHLVILFRYIVMHTAHEIIFAVVFLSIAMSLEFNILLTLGK